MYLTQDEAARGDYEAALLRVSNEHGLYGVEYIQSKQDTPYQRKGILYVNADDPYTATVFVDFGRKHNPTFRTDWGSYIEDRPSRFA